MKIDFRFFCYAVLVILISLSTASLMFGESAPQDLRLIKAGYVYFEIPKKLPPELRAGNQDNGSVVFSELDEREYSFLYFLSINWSKKAIGDSSLLRKPEYTKQSENSSKIVLKKDPNASATDTYFSITKPCGKVLKENLRTVKFYDKKTRTYYAVSGLIRPVLSTDDLLTIAQSLKYECD